MLVDLLAAVPSVVYGLWGVFVLIPKLCRLEKWFARHVLVHSLHGRRHGARPNYFIAGLILAIMILPIVSAISREVIATVPAEHKEAALALGATRWEMIRMAVLPYSRAGDHRRRDARARTRDRRDDRGGARDRQRADDRPLIFQPGLHPGRGDRERVRRGGTTPIHSSALFAAGLVLFVLTLLVNIVAGWFVVARAWADSAAAGDVRRRTAAAPA